MKLVDKQLWRILFGIKEYYKKIPKGLSVARMIAHITYLSETALQRKFGRNLQNSDFFSFNFDTDFQIESY